ncbi:sterol-binding protein [Kitasatospora sp. MMS16-BH015]|uniref:alkyl sulfatase C-terminal domain-containing protein n=1 Tax=Kitasatospora sp. MMS16-BH015 TaxID=2018025 RepID=UPI000CA1CFF2|nr:alkyl sulfatase C-terminal domain-containing protein [Kitasatospora sp. MMS16-BH015]AUG80354.1 sterol-binding protein [Kitasatospora sp. MMS16-BH015]
MATTEQCREALEQLSRNLAGTGGEVRKATSLDRSLSCHLTDLATSFTGRLQDGALTGITENPGPPPTKAEIRLTMTSDDLVALVAGRLSFAPAWATGRIKLEAGLRDLLRLKSLL